MIRRTFAVRVIGLGGALCFLSMSFIQSSPLAKPSNASASAEVAGSSEKNQANIPPDWAEAKEAYDKFLQAPSSSTAREFYILISSGRWGSARTTGILDHIFGSSWYENSYGRYPIVAIEMLDGNIYAAQSAIRLLGFIDNGWKTIGFRKNLAARSIGSSLGNLIRVKPALFLRACYEEKSGPYLQERGCPVGIIPEIMDARTRALYELEMRREALRAVEDPELQVLRDECLQTIEKGIEELESGICRETKQEHEEEKFDNPRTEVINAFAEMQKRPSPENMQRVLKLFDYRREDFNDILNRLFPASASLAFQLIIHEARCGNVAAVEIVLASVWYASRYDDVAATNVYRSLSNLILIQPEMFIERLAKHRYHMEEARPDTAPANRGPANFLDLVCNYISLVDYPSRAAENVILRRRIASLADLNMPEHKDLIERCIRMISKELR